MPPTTRPNLRPFLDKPAVSCANLTKETVTMHGSNTQRFHLSCQAPVSWLCAISNGSHLIHLDWNQIGWTDPDRPDRVSRETITQLMAYFAGQRTNFNIPLSPANISPARQHWFDIMARIPYGTNVSYAAFAAAAGAPNTARATGTACAKTPYPSFALVTA